MKPKKERMYMASMIQQPSQQISTETLAHQKRKVIAGDSTRCGASSFFFPIFVFHSTDFVFHSTDSTKSTVESVSNISVILPDGMAEAAIMYGGVASGTKIRIIRIYGRTPVATPPNQNRKTE